MDTVPGGLRAALSERLDGFGGGAQFFWMAKKNRFKWFNTSPEIISFAVMLYVRIPLSLRNVEDLLHKRSIDISYETVHFWWGRFGPIFAAEIRKRRAQHLRNYSNWQWHLDDGAARQAMLAWPSGSS